MNRILFIASREPSYSRVSIVREGLKQHFEVDEIVSDSRSYRLRMIAVLMRFVWAWMTFKLRKVDGVFVGFFAQPIFPLIRLLYRGPIIADAYFSLFDTYVNDKAKTSSDSMMGKACFWLDQHMLRKADMCFTDTEEHVAYLKNTFAANDADVRRLWISAESKPLLEPTISYEPDETFRVFFWGGFIPLQGVETIVRAADQLKSENVEFTIFGTGQTLEECQALKSGLNTHNLEFKGWQLPSEISKEAEHSHVALGIFGTTEKAGRVIPNKAYEALAMGIPLITRSSKASDELLEDGHNCLLAEAGNPDALANRIRWARDNFAEAVEIAKRGQALFEQVCSPSNIGKIMKREIQSMASNKSRRPISKETHEISHNPISRNKQQIPG